MGAVLAHLAFYPPPCTYTSAHCTFLPTKRGRVAIRSFTPSSAPPRLAILYCHGNACDIGMNADIMQMLADTLACVVYLFDYYGYGLSTPMAPCEECVSEATRNAWDYLVKEGWDPGTILIYGHSIGSGAAVTLGQHLAWEGVNPGGIVIHSGFRSATSIVSQWVRCLVPADLFENDRKIADILCPILVIHGTDDELVPFEHGVHLWSRARHPFAPLWISHGHHNDLLDIGKVAYLQRMNEFCQFLLSQRERI